LELKEEKVISITEKNEINLCCILKGFEVLVPEGGAIIRLEEGDSGRFMMLRTG
jgi:uncharacterized cupin superfamily protein